MTTITFKQRHYPLVCLIVTGEKRQHGEPIWFMDRDGARTKSPAAMSIIQASDVKPDVPGVSLSCRLLSDVLPSIDIFGGMTQNAMNYTRNKVFNRNPDGKFHEFTCSFCGMPFWTVTHRPKSQETTSCSKDCFSAIRRKWAAEKNARDEAKKPISPATGCDGRIEMRAGNGCVPDYGAGRMASSRAGGRAELKRPRNSEFRPLMAC